MEYLEDCMAEIYRTPDEASLVLLRAGIKPGNVDLTGSPRLFWFRALSEAWSQGKLDAILKYVSREYPINKAAIERTLPEFYGRKEKGGGPPPEHRPVGSLAVASVGIVGICFLGFLAYLCCPRPVPRSTEEIWKSIA